MNLKGRGTQHSKGELFGLSRIWSLPPRSSTTPYFCHVWRNAWTRCSCVTGPFGQKEGGTTYQHQITQQSSVSITQESVAVVNKSTAWHQQKHHPSQVSELEPGLLLLNTFMTVLFYSQFKTPLESTVQWMHSMNISSQEETFPLSTKTKMWSLARMQPALPSSVEEKLWTSRLSRRACSHWSSTLTIM